MCVILKEGCRQLTCNDTFKDKLSLIIEDCLIFYKYYVTIYVTIIIVNFMSKTKIKNVSNEKLNALFAF